MNEHVQDEDHRSTEVDAAAVGQAAPDVDSKSTSFYGEYDAAGVDLSLLRWFLKLSPRQRLEAMEQHARDTQALNEYGRRHRETKAGKGR